MLRRFVCTPRVTSISLTVVVAVCVRWFRIAWSRTGTAALDALTEDSSRLAPKTPRMVRRPMT
jgi:hypothetical protein